MGIAWNKIKPDPYLKPFTQINSKYTRDLSVKHETTRASEASMGWYTPVPPKGTDPNS